MSRKLLRRVSTSFAAQAWALSLTLVDRVILVGILLRVWGTDLYADWATLLAAANLITMGELGLNVYLGNAWQRAFAHKDEPAFQRLLFNSIGIYLMLGMTLMIAICGYAFATNLSEKLSLQVVDADTALVIFLVLAAAFVLRVMRGSISQIYRGRGQFAAGTMINSLSTGVTIVTVAIAAYFGAQPVHVALLYLVVDSICGGSVMVYDLHQRFPHLQFRPASPSKAELSDIVEHGKWYAILQAAPIAWLQLPVLMISAFGLGGLAVVSFLIQRTLVNFSRQIPEMLARSVGVETAGEFHLGDKERLSRIFSAFGPFLSALSGAFAGGLVMFAPAVVTIWTGNPNTYNPSVLLWLLAPSILVVPATPLKNMLTLGNLPRPLAIAHLVQLGAGLPICLILMQNYAIEGAAAGLAIGEAAAIGILLPILAKHHLEEDYLRYVAKCSLTLGITVLWTAFAAWAILAIVGADKPVLLASSALLWAAFGLAPSMYFATPPQVRKQMIDLVADLKSH